MINYVGVDELYNLFLRYLLFAIASRLLTVEIPPLMADSTIRKVLGSVINSSCKPVNLSATCHVYPGNVQQ